MGKKWNGYIFLFRYIKRDYLMKTSWFFIYRCIDKSTFIAVYTMQANQFFFVEIQILFPKYMNVRFHNRNHKYRKLLYRKHNKMPTCYIAITDSWRRKKIAKSSPLNILKAKKCFGFNILAIRNGNWQTSCHLLHIAKHLQNLGSHINFRRKSQ